MEQDQREGGVFFWRGILSEAAEAVAATGVPLLAEAGAEIEK